MAYVILIIVVIILYNANSQENIKKLNEKEKIINELKKEINELKNEKAEVEKRFNDYKEIRKDSLKLNVVEEFKQGFKKSKRTLEDKQSVSRELTGSFDNAEHSSMKLKQTHEESKLTVEIPKYIPDDPKQILEKEKRDSYELNEEKKELFNLIENTNKNVFITGKAGTGKSYLLKCFRNKTNKKVLYCAPTGIAALNIEGVTLHSAFGWKNLKDENDIQLSINMISLLKSLDAIVIDEISMVRVDTFNQIDKILKKSNSNDLPFGGKQIILFGDLFQLPPVTNKEEAEYLTDKYGGIFFFNSPAYNQGNFEFREIVRVYRQVDIEFIEILNNIRIGKIDKQQIDSLNNHYVEKVPRRVVQIVPKKSDASRINTESLEKLEGSLFEYQANVVIGDSNNIMETDFPCDFNLKLKVGALVMMLTNDQEQKRWVNGTLGIVSELSKKVVKVIINGTEYEISPVSFNRYKCEYNREKRKLEYIVESCVNQFPIILAYAITIHKSQGMTYQQIACNLDNCFAPGQAYVALSRCANYDKLYLTEKIKASSIITNNVVINFYNKVNNVNSDK